MVNKPRKKTTGYVETDLAIKWLPLPLEFIISIKSRTIPDHQKERFYILQSSPKFVEKVSEIRKMFGIPEFNSTRKDYEDWARKLWKSAPNKNLFDEAIDVLLRQSNASQRWRQAIEFFVIYNKKPDHLVPPTFECVTYRDRNFVSIKLNKHTTLRDICDEWDIIEKAKDSLDVLSKKASNSSQIKGSFLELKNGNLNKHKAIKKRRNPINEGFALQKQAYDLQREGFTYPEIAKKMGFGGDYTKIGHLIERFKEKIEDNELY